MAQESHALNKSVAKRLFCVKPTYKFFKAFKVETPSEVQHATSLGVDSV